MSRQDLFALFVVFAFIVHFATWVAAFSLSLPAVWRLRSNALFLTGCVVLSFIVLIMHVWLLDDVSNMLQDNSKQFNVQQQLLVPSTALVLSLKYETSHPAVWLQRCSSPSSCDTLAATFPVGSSFLAHLLDDGTVVQTIDVNNAAIAGVSVLGALFFALIGGQLAIIHTTFSDPSSDAERPPEYSSPQNSVSSFNPAQPPPGSPPSSTSTITTTSVN